MPQTPYPGGEVTRILISLDVGSSETKAVYMLLRSDGLRLGHTESVLRKAIPVVWENGQASIPTQLAYVADTISDTLTYRQIWGCEVTQYLEDGKIQGEDVLRYFKPVLWGADQRDRDILRNQIRRLPQAVRETAMLKDLTGQGRRRHIEPADLYADSLRYAYAYVLRKIAESERELLLPLHDDLNLYHGFVPDGIQLEVGIPLPGASTTEQVQLVIAAARKAGIANPFPVAEPTAALTYYFQSEFEMENPPPDGSTVMVVDQGGGSADVQVLCRQQSDHGFLVREMVHGDTEWCGGRLANEICRKGIMTMLKAYPSDMHKVLDSLATPEGPMTVREFEILLEQKFEKPKRGFTGRDPAEIRIDGFPSIPSLGYNQIGRIPLSQEDMAEMFALSIDKINAMICRTIEKVHEAGATVDKILLVGGGFNSRYMRNRIRLTYESTEDSAAGYPIPVAAPHERATSSSSTVAYGSLLLLADKAFINERIIRRGFCVAWDKDKSEIPGRRYPAHRVFRDPHDNVVCVREVARYLIRAGDRLPWSKYVEVCEGWRALSLQEKGQIKHQWTIREALYYCDKACRDNDLVRDSTRSGIHPMPNPILFELSEKECEGFEFRAADGSDPPDWYRYVQYEVALILEGMRMTFELRIPRSGKLGPKRSYLERYGPDPIVKSGEYDNRGVFKLIDSYV